MWKVSNVTCTQSGDNKILSYLKTFYDEQGNITKSNVRMSTMLKPEDTEALAAVDALVNFLNNKENINNG